MAASQSHLDMGGGCKAKWVHTIAQELHCSITVTFKYGRCLYGNVRSCMKLQCTL